MDVCTTCCHIAMVLSGARPKQWAPQFLLYVSHAPLDFQDIEFLIQNHYLNLSLDNSLQENGIIKPENRHDKGTFTEYKKLGTKDNLLISHSPVAQQDSRPPLVSALKASAEQNVASFHFPGHNRGRAAPPSLTSIIGLKPFYHDLPELPELDNLLSPEGPILEAQRRAAKLFGSLETWFLVGGTTCGIQAAIMATCSPGEILILPRNSHISAISAVVLSGARPKYIIPHYDFEWDIAGGVTLSQVSLKNSRSCLQHCLRCNLLNFIP